MANEVLPNVWRDEDLWPTESAMRRKRAAAAALGITGREHEVLRLVVEGLTNAQIGAVLFVGVETVKSHVQRLLLKLDAKTRAQLVAEAFRRDLVV